MIVTTEGEPISEGRFKATNTMVSQTLCWQDMEYFKERDPIEFAKWLGFGENHRNTNNGIERDVYAICPVWVIDITTPDQIEQLVQKYGTIEIKKSKYKSIPLEITL